MPNDDRAAEREKREERLQSIYAEFLRAKEAGEAVPSIEKLKQLHPDLADELEIAFEDPSGLSALAGAAPPVGATDVTKTRDALETGPRAESFARPKFPQIEGFEILDILGEGGMGIVYKARHIKGNFLVALKMMKTHFAPTSAQIDRFLREIKLHGSLDHPNIIKIFHVEHHKGIPFFTMKLVTTGTLKSRLDRYRLPASETQDGKRKDLPRGLVMKSARRIARLMARVAEAVHYAHLHRLLHRDLKPGNILLQGRDHPFVADFGLTAHLDESTGTDSIAGTPPYMAPEQVKGDSLLSTAVDVYGIGAILYELLTGRAPFDGKGPGEILEKVRTQSPIPPSQIVSRVPRDLEGICLRCLQRDPGKRFASARDVARALDNFDNRKPIKGITGFRRRVLLWILRRPSAAALICLSIALLSLGLGFGIARYQAIQQEAAQSAAVAYRSKMREASDALARDLAGPASGLAAECPPQLRNIEWHFLDAACQPDVVEKLTHWNGIHVSGVASNLAGDSPYATAHTNGEVLLWANGGKSNNPPIWASSYQINSLASGFRGKYLSAADVMGECYVWNVTNAPVATLFHSAVTDEKDPSRDRVALARLAPRAAFAGNGKVEVWDLEPNVPRFALDFPGDVICLALSPDGKWLAAGGMFRAGGNMPLKVWDLSGVEAREQPLGKSIRLGKMIALAWGGPNGNYLAAATGLTTVIWDVTTGRMTQALPGYESRPFALAFDDSGLRLAASFKTESVKIWDLTHAPQLMHFRGWKPKLGQPGSICIALDGTGEHLATSRLNEVSIERWKYDGGTKPHAGRRYAFDPNGNILAVAFDDGSVHWLNSKTLKEIDSLPPNKTPVTALAFDSTGTMLVLARGNAISTWSGPKTAEVPLYVHVGKVTGVTWTRNTQRNWVASSDEQNLVQVWDVTAARFVVKPLKHNEAVTCVAFSPDGAQLATGCLDWSVSVWDIASWTRTQLEGHDLNITSLAYLPDGRLVSGSDDNTARLWETDSAGLIKCARVMRHYVGVSDVAVAPNAALGPRVITMGQDGILRFWDPFETLADKEPYVAPAEVRRELLALRCRHAHPGARGLQIALNPSPSRRQLVAAFASGPSEVREGGDPEER